jgi:hypothetical protein
MRATILAVIACFAFASCNGAATKEPETLLPLAAAQPQPAAIHHLYVAAAANYTGSGLGLERFPIIDGKPAKSPDLVYPDASGPMAVAPDGSLYANEDLRLQTIDRFASGSVKPESRLIAEPCGHGYIYDGLSTFTFDPAGDLYVNITEGISGARSVHARGCPSQFIAVYGPGAAGRAPPINKIDVGPNVSSPVFGMAIDASGDLAISVESSAVRVYADPTTKTQLVRLFSSRVLPEPAGLAFDPGHPIVYVANASPPAIVVLPADAQGPTRPKRLIKNPAAQGYCGQIALLGAFFFVADAATGTVYEFRKDEHGSPKPFASVSVPFPPCGVAVD